MPTSRPRSARPPAARPTELAPSVGAEGKRKEKISPPSAASTASSTAVDSSAPAKEAGAAGPAVEHNGGTTDSSVCSSSSDESEDAEGGVLSGAEVQIQMCREISFSLTETDQGLAADAVARLLLGTADDGHSTAVELIHDGRRHPTRELKWPNMSRLVEPALCVCIDVPVLSQHEMGIAAKDGLAAVGLADLHLVSDCPVIISDGCAVMFDPSGVLGAHLYIEPGWHGRLIVLDDQKEPVHGMSEQSACSDVLNTLDGIFGLGVAGKCAKKSVHARDPCTQIRLPLRTATEARNSLISGVEAASAGFVATLLKTVEDFSEPAIVFGRSLESVSWSEGQ